MKLSLVVMTAGKSQGQAIAVTLPQFIIGRDPQCNLRPASAVISKRHCALLTKKGKVSVRDFDSTNGTFVNDVQVKGEFPLKNNDVLKIGPLEFKVVLEAKGPAAKATPPPAAKRPTAPAQAGDHESVAGTLLSLQEEGTSGAAAATSAEDSNIVGAMLLSLQEEGTGGAAASTSGEDSNIPVGSTVMDILPLPPEKQDEAGKSTTEAAKSTTPPAPGKKEEKKGDPAHLAAKAILDKYTRRPRGKEVDK